MATTEEEWSSQVTSVALAAGVVVGTVLLKKAMTPSPVYVDKEAPSLRCSERSLSTFKPRVSEATTDRTAEAVIHYAKEGPASEAECPASTFSAQLDLCVDMHGDSPAMRTEQNIPPLGKGDKPPQSALLAQWRTWTYREYRDEVEVVARAFVALGMERFDAVSIYGFNSPEWVMSEMAAIVGGGVAAGIYPTDTPAQVVFKANHSGSSVACVEDLEKAEMLLSYADQLPALKAVVVWGSGDFKQFKKGNVTVLPWSSLGNIADKGCTQSALNERKASQRPGHVCAYIYTSGTTGNPKAVMITHDNILFETKTVLGLMTPTKLGEGKEERILSYLPLSHVAGMLVDIVLPIMITARGPAYCCTHFARNYDLKAGTIGDRLRAVRPTCFLGVPRVWEKVAEKMKAMVAANPLTGVKLKLARWAKGKGLEHGLNCQIGGSGAKGWGYGIAEAKVLRVVKQKLGLDACKVAITGAAPMHTDTLEYFGQLGIQINEVYGMSECCGATTWSTDAAHAWGSCGWAPEGIEVKILDEQLKPVPYCSDIKQPEASAQGEVCFRGRHVMMGYMGNPALGAKHMAEIAKKNADAIAPGNWLRSGDKGCMDARGMVRITGRYKELIITAGGENIAPVPIEDNIKKLHQGISNVMMFGDMQKYNVALITLKAKGATGVVPGGDDLDTAALAIKAGVTTISGACTDKDWIASVTNAIIATNKDHVACPSNAAKIQKFTILPHDFSSETDEFTPTYKLKRTATADKYRATLDAMYESKETYVPFRA